MTLQLPHLQMACTDVVHLDSEVWSTLQLPFRPLLYPQYILAPSALLIGWGKWVGEGRIYNTEKRPHAGAGQLPHGWSATRVTGREDLEG